MYVAYMVVHISELKKKKKKSNIGCHLDLGVVLKGHQCQDTGRVYSLIIALYNLNRSTLWA